MDLQRFFIALVPPPEIQASVNEIKRYFDQCYGSRQALNSPPHITLQAPFEWSNERDLRSLTEGLRGFAAGQAGMEISLRNYGVFPPHVIYIDVVQSPGLMGLQKDLAMFMENSYGFVDRRHANFCPHMTVAFRDLTKAAFDQAWPEFQQKTITFDFMAMELTLLCHNDRHWQISQRYPLAPMAPPSNPEVTSS
ncbi:2'-5' RNA ligase family protein [Leptothoe sp. PORK10 BA2]|uniref:2'-5' RNA ligase family protein n=1 Tax=Leptothoe sp. PORK10 BA2 TaxID=3110254 RepID=UPI002B1FF0BA|nr:2'-5' RNA ligase family protein [Leptothoe sp. PORK10 BA2]MEA5465151.1 2'-5' RNA ligase family protein [Leptothoe sp. PORK10 BA2]